VENTNILYQPFNLPGIEQNPDIVEVRQSEAFRLFADRAEAAAAHFKIDDDNTLTIAKICYQLDGLPLAIELAAARIRLLSPEMILERLSASLEFLTGGARDLPERQQTLRNTLDWSYSLLDPETQTLFCWLSVFAGGFTIEAAEAVCESWKGERKHDVLNGLEVLLDNSLLRRRVSKSGETRFSMLEVIREYAQEQLTKSGKLDAVRDQHAQYFTNKMAEINLLFQTSQSEHNLDWIEEQHDNLRATLTWLLENPAHKDVGALFLASMDWFWFRRGYLSEGRVWSRKMLLQLEPGERTGERVMVLFSNGALAMWQGDLNEAMVFIDEALEIARWLEYSYYLAVILLFKGTTLVNMGRDNEAIDFLEEARTLFEELGIEWYVATTQVHIANAALGQDDTEKSLHNLSQAASSSDQIKEKWLQSFILNNFGEVSRVRGEYDLAQSYYLQSEALFREMGDVGELARLVHNLGYIALHQGNFEVAENQFQESLDMFIKLNNQRGIAENLSAISGLWVKRGDYEAGAQLFGAAQEIIDQTGGSWWPADRVEIEEIYIAIQKELDAKTLEKNLAAGKLMMIEEAVLMAQDRN
jgi:tetratricopeptide (TPR) repeat protein